MVLLFGLYLSPKFVVAIGVDSVLRMFEALQYC